MGEIRKQSIQTSILSYLGVGLGYVNVVLLFPVVFAPEEFGLTRILMAIIGVSAQFALFGLSNTIIRFFPRFKEGDENGQHGLLGLALTFGLIGALIVTVALWLIQPWVVEHYIEKSSLLIEFYTLLFPLLLFEVCYQLFTSYTRALYHSVINVFMRNVFLRACTTVLIGLYHYQVIDFNLFMWLFISQFGVMAIGLAVYLKAIGQFNVKIDKDFLSPELKKELVHYGSFTLLSSVSAIFLMNIDVIMIGSMVGLEQTAFYAVAFYIVGLMNVPKHALSNISIPVISAAWKRNDRDEIQKIYSKTSINLLLAGTLLLVGIWANERNIFQILPEVYSDGKWVLLVLGIARLMDVGFGINGGIIITSEWYKFDTYANIMLLVITVVLNLVFIPLHGIVGAAMATGISLGLYNLSKFIFLKVKFDFQPFTWKSLLTILLGLGSYYCSTLLPVQTNLILDIILRSAIIVLIYIPLALLFNLSDDVALFLKALKTRFGK